MDNLIGILTEQSNEGTLVGSDPLCKIYCVTTDRTFFKADRSGSLSARSVVLAPAQFVVLVQK